MFVAEDGLQSVAGCSAAESEVATTRFCGVMPNAFGVKADAMLQPLPASKPTSAKRKFILAI
jgi:hypothetical protein